MPDEYQIKAVHLIGCAQTRKAIYTVAIQIAKTFDLNGRNDDGLDND